MAPKGDNQFITNQLIENGYSGVFEILKVIADYDKLEKFICYLKESLTIKIKPSKEQLLILNELFKKFSKEKDIVILETLVISLYSDYLPTCYSTMAKQYFIFETILDMILIDGSMDNYKTKLSKSTIISSLIDTNLNNFDNNLIKIIIKKLLDYFNLYKTTNQSKLSSSLENKLNYLKIIFLIIQLLLKLKENGVEEEQLVSIEYQISECLKSKIFLNLMLDILKISSNQVYQPHNPLNSDFKRLNYGSNSNDSSITSNVTNYILESCSSSSGIDKFSFSILSLVLLLFQTKSNSRIFQRKMKNEIFNGVGNFFKKVILGHDQDSIISSSENDVEVHAFNQTGFKEIVNLLIDNQQFDLISIKNLILPYYETTDLKDVDPDDLVESLPFDLSISIFSILLRDKKIKKSKVIEFVSKKTLDISDGNEINKCQIKSVFNINENQFHHYDEFILFEIYEKHFEKLISTLDLESILPSLFNNLENSPIKFKFIKSKLNYFIQSLNYNSISNFITSTKQPYLIEKCEKSKIYNLKKIENYLFKQQDNSSSSTPAPAVPVLSNVLIQEIILKYVDNKSTSMYQKLQISLVSKRFYEIVKGFINSSTTTPVLINVSNFDFVGNFYRESREMATMNKSLITKDVKYVKLDFEPSYESRHSTKFFTLFLNNCKSLEILHLSNLEISYNPLFAYLCWFKSLNKLIIQIPSDSYENFKLYKLIENLENSRTTTTTTTTTGTDETTTTVKVNPIKIQLLMDTYDGPSQSSKINYSKLSTLSIPIDEYFRHSSFKKIIGLNELDLVIAHYVETTEIIKYCKKHFTFKDDESFDKLQVLSIQILGLSCGIYEFFYNIFRFFRNKSKNIKEFKILINLENNSSNTTSLESAISIIFKLLSSSNLIGFQNLKQVTISNLNSQLKSLKNIDSFNFKQRIFNETTINSFEFIKQQEDNNGNVGGGDDDDSDSDLEGFEFNTDSSSYSEDEEEDEEDESVESGESDEYDYDEDY